MEGVHGPTAVHTPFAQQSPATKLELLQPPRGAGISVALRANSAPAPARADVYCAVQTAYGGCDVPAVDRWPRSLYFS